MNQWLAKMEKDPEWLEVGTFCHLEEEYYRLTSALLHLRSVFPMDFTSFVLVSFALLASSSSLVREPPVGE